MDDKTASLFDESDAKLDIDVVTVSDDEINEETALNPEEKLLDLREARNRFEGKINPDTGKIYERRNRC